MAKKPLYEPPTPSAMVFSLESQGIRRGTRASGQNPRALGTNPRAMRAAAEAKEAKFAAEVAAPSKRVVAGAIADGLRALHLTKEPIRPIVDSVNPVVAKGRCEAPTMSGRPCQWPKDKCPVPRHNPSKALIEAAGILDEMASRPQAYCKNCGRELTNPVQRALGYGPECARVLSIQ